MKQFTLGLVSLLLAGCSYQVSPSGSEKAAGSDGALPVERIEELLSIHNVPGMAYAKLRSCKVVETGVAGLANVEDRTKIQKNTLFEAASISKPVFAWLVMSLVQEGVINLDEPFAEAGFSYRRIPDEKRFATLTPRLVLAHRTGLPNWSGDSGNAGRGDPIRFENEPGTYHSYSGEAYLLLQRFVEAKTGQSLQELFEQRLGELMPHSTFRRPFSSDARTSYGYFRSQQTARAALSQFSESNAAFSLVTTASDLGRFLQLVCDRQGLSAESYEDMLRVQTDALPDGDQPKRWRLGWEAISIRNRDAVFHTGDNGNYMSMAFFFEEGDGYVVMTNADTGLDFINQFLREAGAGEKARGLSP